jgi:hypothetical protein
MRTITYTVRGFLTARSKSLRVPLRGSLTLRVDTDSGLFTGDLDLEESPVQRMVLGTGLLRATVRITPRSPVVGGFDHEKRAFAAVTVSAVLSEAELAGHPLSHGGSWRTEVPAVVSLRSGSAFDLERGGRLAGCYLRPRFTGRGRIRPLINALAAGPSYAVIDLAPIAG